MTLENFYVYFWTTLIGLTVGVACVAALLHWDTTTPHHAIPEWETTVTLPVDPETVPGPAPKFPVPLRYMIDAMLGTTAAHAAAHPVKADPPLENTYLYPTPMKLWAIEQQATEDNHVSCSATRTIEGGAVMSVKAYKNKTIELTLSEVNFHMHSEQPYKDAVVSIDGEPVDVTVAKRVSKWVTKFDLTETNLQKLAEARILRLTVGVAYIELDMTGSANAAKYVAMCNASGQNMVHRRIVDAAKPAEIRSAGEQ